MSEETMDAESELEVVLDMDDIRRRNPGTDTPRARAANAVEDMLKREYRDAGGLQCVEAIEEIGLRIATSGACLPSPDGEWHGDRAWRSATGKWMVVENTTESITLVAGPHGRSRRSCGLTVDDARSLIIALVAACREASR